MIGYVGDSDFSVILIISTIFQVINRKIEELGIKTVFLPLNSTYETFSQYSESLK